MSRCRSKRIAVGTAHLVRFTSLPTMVGGLPVALAIRGWGTAVTVIVRPTLGFRVKARPGTNPLSVPVMRASVTRRMVEMLRS